MLSGNEKGISFTGMLLMLAHYKFIDDNKALRYFMYVSGAYRSLDEFLRRRAKLVRVTNQLNDKIFRGLFVTLYWRRQFLARRESAKSPSIGGKYLLKIELSVVPAIVVEETDSSQAPFIRPPLPSLDLTQMRDDMGSGYASSSGAFGEGDHQLRVSFYSPQSDSEDESASPGRRWANIGGPESQMAAGTQLYYLFVRGILTSGLQRWTHRKRVRLFNR